MKGRIHNEHAAIFFLNQGLHLAGYLETLRLAYLLCTFLPLKIVAR